MSVGRVTAQGKDENLTDSVPPERPGGKPLAGGDVPVMDYEGSGYRQDFWEGQGREYEDAVERLALEQLIPARGGRIAEVGAGFGRLADLYLGYDQIVLFDYSRTLLEDAVRNWGTDARFVFVAGNVYQMPLTNQVLDTLVMVRVMHHLADVPTALSQLHRIVHRGGCAVLEYANKRNLKAMLRWATRKQAWSPFDKQPLEFVALNFDFHPNWMDARLQEAGFQATEQFGVSHFRLGALKKRVPADTLARLDSHLFRIGGHYPCAPSVFVQASAVGGVAPADFSTDPSDVHRLFQCPACATYPLELVDEAQVLCPSCGRTFMRRHQIWDFKLID